MKSNEAMVNLKKIPELSVQLDDNVQKLRSYTTYESKPKKAIVTFIDDDAPREVMERLYPIFKKKQVPCSLAVITGYIDTDKVAHPDSKGSMKRDDLITVSNEGWELLGHGHDYINNLGELSDLELKDNLELCSDYLYKLKPNTKGFVYPQSVHNLNIRNRVREHFDFSFAGTGFVESTNVNTFAIPRISFGYASSLNPPVVEGVQKANTLEYYKACIDYAEKKGIWIVFMMHCWDSQFDGTMLEQLIDYIKSKSIDILNPSDAYSIFGNNIFIGDKEDRYISINKYGVETGTGSDNIMLDDDIKKSNDGINTYPMGVSVCKIGNSIATSENFPELKAGVLKTYRYEKNYYFNRQEYYIYMDTPLKFVRYPKSNTTWSEWSIADGSIIRNNTILITNTPKDFINKIKYVDKVTSEYMIGKGFPVERTGIIITERFQDGYDYWFGYQQYITVDNDIFIRYQTSGTTWNDWVQISTSKNKIITGKITGLYFNTNANSCTEQEFTVVGARPNMMITVYPENNGANILPVGLIYDAICTQNDKIKIRVYNITSNNINDTTKNWVYRIE